MQALKNKPSSKGFTLIEMIIVMVIIGIIASTTVFFMLKVFKSVGESRDRMLLTDQARASLSRMKRDLRLSLPNSIRASSVGSITYLEFVPIGAVGRYRVGSGTGVDTPPNCAADSSTLTDNSVLTIGAADSCFKSIGIPDVSNISVGDWLVIFNAGVGYSGANVYESGSVSGGNKSSIAAITSDANDIKFDFVSNTYLWDSPGHRFFVAKNPITYVCDNTNGALYRVSGYSMQQTQPTSSILTLQGASQSFILKSVTSCSLSYTSGSISGQMGLVTLGVSMSSASGDNVSLQVQTLVENRP